MSCAQCNNNPDGSQFCNTCGQPLTNSPTETAPLPEQAPIDGAAGDQTESGDSKRTKGVVLAFLAVAAILGFAAWALLFQGGGFDSSTASAEEKFDYFEKRVVELGGDPTMTSAEAADVSRNTCDNDADAMLSKVAGLLSIEDLTQIRAEQIALVEAYCPDALAILEQALGDPDLGPDAAARIRGVADLLGLEANVGRDGDSIAFDTQGEEDFFGDEYFEVVAVLRMLEAPDFVTDRIEGTRALDGTQEVDWAVANGTLVAFWTYHPDDGLQLTLYAE